MRSVNIFGGKSLSLCTKLCHFFIPDRLFWVFLDVPSFLYGKEFSDLL